MSVKAGILAMLSMGECHGYQLRQEIESRTGGSWQINIGQVYATLERLERDGLVVGAEGNEQGQTLYELTEAGKMAAAEWLSTAVATGEDARNELALKLALAVTIPGCDVAALVNAQRMQTMRTLQALTSTKRDVTEADLAWLLIVDLKIFNAEAELRWLEHIEGTLARATARGLDSTQDLASPARRGRPAKAE